MLPLVFVLAFALVGVHWAVDAQVATFRPQGTMPSADAIGGSVPAAPMESLTCNGLSASRPGG